MRPSLPRVLLAGLVLFRAAGVAAQSAPVQAATLEKLLDVPLPDDVARIERAEFSASGRLALVLDGANARMILYDSALARFTAVSRKGEGPGELTRIGGLLWTGDTLAVEDNWRMSLFGGDGKHLRTISQREWAYPAMALLARLPNGAWIASSRPGQGTRKDLSRDSLYVFSVDERNPGAPAKLFTIASPPLSMTIRFDGGSMMTRQPFVAWTMVDYDTRERNIVVASSGESARAGEAPVTIAWHAHGGNRVAERTHAFPAIAIPKDYKKTMIDAMVKTHETRGRSADQLRQLRQGYEAQMVIPDFKPALENALLSPGNEVWFTALRGPAERVICRAAKAPATPTRCASLPPKAYLLTAGSNGRVLLHSVDADDVPVLTLYHLR